MVMAVLCSAAARVLRRGLRKRLIDPREKDSRLDGLVDQLTRANLSYQEYSKTV